MENFEDFTDFVRELEQESELPNETDIAALIPANMALDAENLQRTVAEFAGFLSREDSQKYQAVVLNAPYGAYKFRVGLLKPLTVDEKRSLSRILLGFYSTSSIKFQILDGMLFEILKTVAYEKDNVARNQSRQEQQQTRGKRVWGGDSGSVNQRGSKTASQTDDEDINLEDLAGTRIDISNLDTYYDLKTKFESGELNENSVNTFTFVKFLLQDFILSGGSDLHVHSRRGGGRIRYRFQGQAYTRFDGIPAQRYQQIVNSLCTLAAKDPSKMKQGGVASVIKLKIMVDNEVKPVEFRFQSNPTLHNPSVILRGQAKPLRDISKCGFTDEQLAIILEAINRDRGIVVVTGPTGSGKTNTLNCVFAILEEKDDLVIIEIGAPIEIESPTRLQITMFESASEAQNDIIRQRTFADAMRSDPDVIGYTEIRTYDESRIAFRAAVTGHRVFTTLHAADAEETFGRLFEMGIERSIISKGILAIVAQTLVRKLCLNCRIPDLEASQIAGHSIYRENETGCANCDDGFSGRTVIAEVLGFNDDVQRMINEGYKASEIVQMAIEKGYLIPMKRIALAKLNAGITSESEVINLLELKTSLNTEMVEMPNEDDFESLNVQEGELIEL